MPFDLFVDLGYCPYKEAWEYQKLIHQKRVKNIIPDTLILVEHNHVITRGRTPGSLNLKVDQEYLKNLGVEFYHVERGGDITYHGPGQIVGYPIFKLSEDLTSVKRFVMKIQEAISHSLDYFGLKTEVYDKIIGVFVEKRKIASIGIAVKDWVSFHGFALNVNTDLRFFNLIYPCGFRDIEMTSMEKELGTKIDVDEVKKKIVEGFERVFGKELREFREWRSLLSLGS